MAPDGRTISGSVDLTDRAALHPGAECFANVSIYAYNKGGSSYGVSAGLNGVALTGRDLGRFDSRPSAGQMFGAGAAPDAPPPAAAGAPAPVYPPQAPAPVYPPQAPALAYPPQAPAPVYPQAPAPVYPPVGGAGQFD